MHDKEVGYCFKKDLSNQSNNRTIHISNVHHSLNTSICQILILLESHDYFCHIILFKSAFKMSYMEGLIVIARSQSTSLFLISSIILHLNRPLKCLREGVVSMLILNPRVLLIQNHHNHIWNSVCGMKLNSKWNRLSSILLG